MKTQPLPSQEIVSRIVAPKSNLLKRSPFWWGLGTMPRLNRRWMNQPIWDFVNYNLRGFGQVVFVNNPLSGLLILIALFGFAAPIFENYCCYSHSDDKKPGRLVGNHF